MHIEIENVSNNEVIRHQVLLISGSIQNFCKSVKGKLYIYCHHAGENYEQTYEIPVVNSQFKYLFSLVNGQNSFAFEFRGIFKTIQLTHENDSVIKRIITPVYIVPKDSDGRYQAPSHIDSSANAACAKISLAVKLIQSFIADGLMSHGLGRKTFILSQCQIFISSLSTLESHSLSQSKLWEFHAKELLSAGLINDNAKVLGVLGATRYINDTGRHPLDHDEMMSFTKSHVALGGGGLALFGSGCLYTWPSTIDTVQDFFCNEETIDPIKFMDDSGYRHTYGACFSTTLGALTHELGHILDLGHTEDGIMARGFDDILRYFTIQAKDSKTASDKLLSDGVISPVDEENICLSPTFDKRFTSFRKDGSDYLRAYQQKKELRKMVQDKGRAFWSRSCALILSHHKWINPESQSIDEPQNLCILGGIVSVPKSSGSVAVLECRKEDKVVGFLEVLNNQNDPMEFSLEKLLEKYPKTNVVIIATIKGYVWQCHISR